MDNVQKSFIIERGIQVFSKKTLFVILIGLVAILMIGCTSGENNATGPGETGEMAATVNDSGISMAEFEDTVNRTKAFYEQQGFDFENEEGTATLEQIRQQVIDDLVLKEVLMQNAKEKGYDVSDQQISEEIERIKAQFPSDEDFQTALSENQLTEDGLKSMVASELQIGEFFQNEIPKVTVADDEIQQMYDEYKEQYEAQMAESTEDGQEFPSLEEAKGQIEAQLIQQKEQVEYDRMIEELMENSDIEILI
jgi:hypothetical protein